MLSSPHVCHNFLIYLIVLNGRGCQNELSNQEKHKLLIFYLQRLVVPYPEELKRPTQYYDVFENQTDFLRESLMRDKNFEYDHIKDFRKLCCGC